MDNTQNELAVLRRLKRYKIIQDLIRQEKCGHTQQGERHVIENADTGRLDGAQSEIERHQKDKSNQGKQTDAYAGR